MAFPHHIAAKLIGFAVPAAIVFLSTTHSWAGSPLTVTIENVRNADGVVHVLLYDKARPFEAGDIKSLANYMELPAKSGRVTHTFANVKAGKYALLVHHDENANKVFEMKDTLPLEGYAYSNNVGRNAVPKFSAAAFQHAGKKSDLSVAMIYHR